MHVIQSVLSEAITLILAMCALQQLTGASRGATLNRIPLQAWLGGTEASTAGLYSQLLEAAVLQGTMSAQEVLLAQQRPGKPLCLMPEIKVSACHSLKNLPGMHPAFVLIHMHKVCLQFALGVLLPARKEIAQVVRCQWLRIHVSCSL